MTTATVLIGVQRYFKIHTIYYNLQYQGTVKCVNEDEVLLSCVVHLIILTELCFTFVLVALFLYVFCRCMSLMRNNNLL